MAVFRVEIDPAQLGDVRHLERKYSAKFLLAEVWPDGYTVAELEPVADLGWYIEVWNDDARLVLVREDGSCVDASEELELDADLLSDLVAQVVYEDHGSDRSVNRAYYPLSRRSVELFQRLMAGGRAGGA